MMKALQQMSFLKFFDTRKGKILLFALQLVCVVFFVFDFSRAVFGIPEQIGFFDLEILEIFVVVVMVASMLISGRQLALSQNRSDQLQTKLQAASGEFNNMLQACFTEWRLTNSECDVALLAIKGLGISEISKMRETKEGTIKAQLNLIYRKANVSGRPQLISYFVEELMTGDFNSSGLNSSDSEKA